jgi:hypothetical protein
VFFSFIPISCPYVEIALSQHEWLCGTQGRIPQKIRTHIDKHHLKTWQHKKKDMTTKNKQFYFQLEYFNIFKNLNFNI